MPSNLITPTDILKNDLHSVTLVDPEQHDVDAVIAFCQNSDLEFNVYVYTPNMDNLEWLNRAVEASDAVIVNSRTDNYNKLCLLKKTYYYGDKNYLENRNKIADPVRYFVSRLNSTK